MWQQRGLVTLDQSSPQHNRERSQRVFLAFPVSKCIRNGFKMIQWGPDGLITWRKEIQFSKLFLKAKVEATLGLEERTLLAN